MDSDTILRSNIRFEGDINTLTQWAVYKPTNTNNLINQIKQFDVYQSELFTKKDLPKIEYHDLFICATKRGWIRNFINMDQFAPGIVNKLLIDGLDIYYLRVLDGNKTRSLTTTSINEDQIRNISFVYNSDFLKMKIDNVIFWSSVVLNWEWYKNIVENENIWLSLLPRAEPRIFQCNYFFRLWRHADDLKAYKIIEYLKKNIGFVEWDADLMTDIIGNDFDFVDKYIELSSNKIIRNEKLNRH